MKNLVRGNEAPESAEVLSDSEFITVALDQISTTAQSIKNTTQSEEVLNGFADILELMQEVLMKHKMSPIVALQHVSAIRQERGSFSEKKAVTKE